MNKSKDKKLNMEPLTSLSSAELRKLAYEDYGNQLQEASFMSTIISNDKGYRNWDDMYWKDVDGKSCPYIGYLFHANSVTTSVDFLDTGYIYSREMGEKLKKQTAQRSDDLDKSLGIYNDIFFDNADIPHYAGTNTSAYGPIMFVFNAETIRGRRVRVTRANPFVRDNLTYESFFFRDVESIRDEINHGGTNRFLMNSMHHTTIYNTGMIPLKGNLEAIYIEKHRSGDGREKRIYNKLRKELDRHGLKDVKLAIRDALPSEDFDGYANNYDVLWKEPEVW